MALRIILVLCLSLISFCSKAQHDPGVYKKLVKRYGTVIPWGRGYILEVMSLHGFADSTGHIKIPTQFVEFDTLLHDRAYIGPNLINENGEVVTRGSYGFRVVNRSRRLLTRKESNFQETLIDDMGNVLTVDPFNSWLPKETMVRSKTGSSITTKFGVITLSGDTILPNLYQSVTCGKNTCAAYRADTAYFFDRTGTLMFAIPKVQGCTVLENDIMAVKKFGLFALVNKDGSLLTGFKLGELTNLYYTDSSLILKDQANLRINIPIPGYVLSGGYPNKYLLDSLGRLLTPGGGYDISMNRSGWMIVKNGRCTDLYDPKKQVVVCADAEYRDMSFLNDRFVLIWERTYTDDSRSRNYDMKARKFVDVRLRQPENQYFEGPSWSSIHGIGMWNLNGLFAPDSICINEARSTLVKRNGFWGVMSITGDTILPFKYDTAGNYPHQKFFVGNKQKVAYLDWEGNLTMPVGLPDLPLKVRDSMAYLKDGSIYNFKGWQLKKVDRKTMPYPSDIKFMNGIAYIDGSTALQRGLYNRDFKKLADEPNELWYSEPIVTHSGITAIRDSAKSNITLIDSTGRKLFKWFKEPKQLVLWDNLALAINDSGETDVLLFYQNRTTSTKKIKLDATIKRSALIAATTTDKSEVATPRPRRRKAWSFPQFPWAFKDKTGLGMINYGSVIQIEGTQSYATTKSGYVKVKIKDQYGLYTWNGSELLPPIYDSISSDYNCWIYKNGKKGFFDLTRGKIIPAIYDSIVRYAVGGLIAGHKNGKAEFVDSSGRVVSSGWHNASSRLYQLFYHQGFDFSGIPVTKYDKAYLLFPSAGDSLLAVPDQRAVSGTKNIKDYADGKILFSRNDSMGVYDPEGSRWVVPLQPGTIERQGNCFISKNYLYLENNSEYPADIAVYTSNGNPLFSVSGSYDGIGQVNFTQWKLWSYNSRFDGPVLNNSGKIIVPAYYNEIHVEPGKYVYKAVSKTNTIWFDTLGGVVVSKELGPMESVSIVDTFVIATQNDMDVLLTKTGKIISNKLFQNITPCTYGLVSIDSIKESLIIDRFGPIENPLPDAYVPFFVVTESASGKQGLIDHSGKITIPCLYDEIEPVMDATKIVAKKDEHWGIINIKNKPLTTFSYQLESL